MFADALARIFDDPDHSDDEPREIIIGFSSTQCLEELPPTPEGYVHGPHTGGLSVVQPPPGF